MILGKDITVVMQGDIRPETLSAIQSVRRVLPHATLVLSTFRNEHAESYRGLADVMVTSDDPGALPPYTVSRFAIPNNLNRQIISSRAGLAKASTPYALKMRTDCVLHSDAFVHLYEGVSQIDPDGDRLVASTFYTRHPDGMSGYLFHISDWFIFGATSAVKQFWDAPLMSMADATWFDRQAPMAGSSPAARRFRTRFTPEQHIATEFGKKRGYQTPHFLNERSELLVNEYKRFLATEFAIDKPEALGFSLPKYAHLSKSIYQNVDCVSRDDWRSLFRDWSLGGNEEQCSGVPRLRTHQHRKQALKKAIRGLAHRFRHPLILAGLARRKIRQSFA